MTFVKLNNRPVKAFNTLVDELFNGLPATANAWRPTGFPPANIHETKNAYHLELSVPGRNKEDFRIGIENGLLTVSFEKQEVSQSDDYKTLRREFGYQSFSRSFTLDEDVDVENIQAKYENGLLKLLVPKKDNPKEAPKQITVQ